MDVNAIRSNLMADLISKKAKAAGADLSGKGKAKTSPVSGVELLLVTVLRRCSRDSLPIHYLPSPLRSDVLVLTLAPRSFSVQTLTYCVNYRVAVLLTEALDT